jgi:hypothetical protein
MTNLDDLVERANRLAEVESENTILRARCESAEKELAGEKRSGERGRAAYIELKSRVSALEAALREIEWSNNSAWQSDRARAALRGEGEK